MEEMNIESLPMTEESCRHFTELLASKASVPGGGGASALAGAIGIALGDMVGELTVGKKKYADVEDEIRSLMEQAQALRKKLLDCVEKDAEAFAPLAQAYAIPKEEPGRDEVMELCLRNAGAVPLEIMRLSAEALVLLKAFAEKGSRLMISDAATGAALCLGALEGAAMNVVVNTRLMKDREYAAHLDEEVRETLERGRCLEREIYDGVLAAFQK